MKNIYLIVGRSGSGKTELTNLLTEKLNATTIDSYTTRPKRSENEKGHIFATEKEYINAKIKNEIVAETLFAGNYYWASKDQVNNADIYIVDPKGAADVKKAYDDKIISKKPIVIKLSVKRKEALKRMLKRGDSMTDANRRLFNDDNIFSDFPYDIKINANMSINDVLEETIAKITKEENES